VSGSDSKVAPCLDAGTILGGRYRIERVLGRGGMGAVYEATRLDLSRRVALKLLDTASGAPADAIKATEREARAAAQLAHPHIVQVFDFSAGDGGPPFLVMEMLEGESLDERLARVGRLEPGAAALVTVQILSALAAAHAAGIVHRDVKPANVFLARTAATLDFVKLLDFGVAWSMTAVASTRAGGAMAGTPAYMAPEQIAGGDLDARTDVWAAGVCLYEMLAGVPPFEADSVAALLVKICEARPRALESFGLGLDASLVAVVAKAMQKDPVDRFQTAEEMRAAVAPFAVSAPVPSRDVGARGRRAVKRGSGVATVRLPEDDAFAPTERAGSSPSEERLVPERPTRSDDDDDHGATRTRASGDGADTSQDSRKTKRSTPHPTLASGDDVRATLATTKPPAKRSRQTGPAFARGATIAAIAAAGAVAVTLALRTPSSTAKATLDGATSSAPVPGRCKLGVPTGPWATGATRLRLSSNDREVLVAVSGTEAAARFASVRRGHAAFEEWETGMPPEAKNDRVFACASRYADGSLAAGMIRARTNAGSRARSTTVRFARGLLDGGVMPNRMDLRASPHDAMTGDCAAAGAMVSFISVGTIGAPAILWDGGADPEPSTIRLFLVDGPRAEDRLVAIPNARDVALGMTRQMIAAAVLRGTSNGTDELRVLLADPRTFLPEERTAVTGGELHAPAIAVTDDEVDLAVLRKQPPRLEWSRWTRELVESKYEVTVEGDLVSPALARRGDDLLLAYGRREGGRTVIHFGVGKTAPEAAARTEAIPVAADVSEIRLSDGASPWLGWIEGTGAGAVVRVAPVECP